MTLRLLHVDDEPDLAELVGIALSLDDNFELRQCANGPDALHMLEDWQADILLLDYMLPGLDGPAILARLVERGQLPKTIFMTARSSNEDRTRLLASGAIGVIEKPFDPMTLAAHIVKLVTG